MDSNFREKARNIRMLLLDVDGFVAEGSGENFFMVRDGVVITPPISGRSAKTVTWTPSLASSAAQDSPAGPEPTMATFLPDFCAALAITCGLSST